VTNTWFLLVFDLAAEDDVRNVTTVKLDCEQVSKKTNRTDEKYNAELLQI
jgi:hypothetical protein